LAERDCTVVFRPDGVTAVVAEGALLIEAASEAGIHLRSSCGGQGTCGQCAVKVLSGPVRQKASRFPSRLARQGFVPACQTQVLGDAEVEVPAFSRQARDEVLLEDAGGHRPGVLLEADDESQRRYPLRPVVLKRVARLEPPTVDGNSDDWSRLRTALRPDLQGYADIEEVDITLAATAALPQALRGGDWEVAVYAADLPRRCEVVRVLPAAGSPPPLGLAVDVGTTTVVVHLVDLEAGRVLARTGTLNRQSRFGDDVITRIIHSAEVPGGGVQLREAVRETVNGLVEEALAKSGYEADDVLCAVVAGNTTMQHLFLGLPADQIRLEPYVPVACRYPLVRGSQLGLKIHGDAPVLMIPAVSSYIGGDIVAGLLASGMADRPELSLFVDIGTNGEMVFGNQEWLMACACSAGPCFEGGGISSGSRAVPGAIQDLRIDPASYAPAISTIGGGPAAGICGSGLIGALSQLRLAGVIDRAGTFMPELNTDRVRQTDDGPEFVLVPAPDTSHGRDIAISEVDVKNLLRAKGAIFAGARSLLAAFDTDFGLLDRIDVAGGFGSSLSIRDAVEIGMLPDVGEERYRFLGNTSVKGARLALLSRAALERAGELAGSITVLELSLGSKYMEEFVSALFLPHTDLSLFPSVTRQPGVSGGLGSSAAKGGAGCLST